MPENKIQTLETLLKALQSAPQDKQGAFKVSTWRMVIEELVAIKTTINSVAHQTEALAINQSAVQDSQKELEKTISDKINTEDVNTILF
jgi:hypothetical protein